MLWSLTIPTAGCITSDSGTTLTWQSRLQTFHPSPTHPSCSAVSQFSHYLSHTVSGVYCDWGFTSYFYHCVSLSIWISFYTCVFCVSYSKKFVYLSHCHTFLHTFGFPSSVCVVAFSLVHFLCVCPIILSPLFGLVCLNFDLNLSSVSSGLQSSLGLKPDFLRQSVLNLLFFGNFLLLFVW